MLKRVFVAVSMFALASCTTLSAPKPGPDAPANDPGVLAVQSAGDLGAIGCGLMTIELKPEELVQAKLATSAAKSVLTDPAPSLSALSAAFSSADVSPRYAVLGALLVQRVKVRLGDADVIPVDTVGYAMAESFVDACQLALG